MKTAYIDVDGFWGIVIYYDYDVSNPKDEDELWGHMHAFGMKDINIKRALNILSNYNTGMCVSNNDIRMSGVFISKANYGADYEEDDAYLTGFLTKRAVELLGEPCR